MKKTELKTAVSHFNTLTREALQTIVNSLNQGQKKKIFKNEAAAEILARYGITADGGGEK